MSTYIIRRVLQALLIIIIVTMVVYLAVTLMPGDPLYIYLTGRDADVLGTLDKISPEQLHALRASFGLDDPLYIQYLHWMGGILHGKFGTSAFYYEDVGVLLRQRLPVSLNFNIFAFALVSLIGWPLGILAAIKRGSKWDSIIIAFTNLGITIPSFWLGILLIYTFGLRLGWLPIQGYVSPFTNLGQNLRYLILPLACMTVGGFGMSARIMRSCMLEVLNQDYMRTARAKGLRERIVIFRHGLKNAMIIPVTGLGREFASLLSGSVLIETIFNIPGVGRLSTSAVFAKDYSIIMAVVLVSATMIVVANLLVDISYAWLDPRIKLGQRGA
jgi:peptide/nickel transport system permease protein